MEDSTVLPSEGRAYRADPNVLRGSDRCVGGLMVSLSKSEAQMVILALQQSVQKLWDDSDESERDKNIRYTVMIAGLMDKFEEVVD
jgi:hypothetical protein